MLHENTIDLPSHSAINSTFVLYPSIKTDLLVLKDAPDFSDSPCIIVRDKPESTLYKYYPRPANKPVGKTISGTGDDVGVDASIKLWSSSPLCLETVFDIEAELKVSAKENVMWIFDGPNKELTDMDSGGEVWTKDEHGNRKELIGASVNGDFQHVRRKAFSECGKPKKPFQLDIDDLICPDGMSAISTQAVEFAISLLPAPLNQASWAYQFSSKAGIEGGLIKLHLFGVMDSACTNDQKEEWLRQNNDESKLKLDYSFYDSVRPIYVKDPIFKDGAIDPFIGNPTPRIGVVKGKYDIILADDIATVTILPAISNTESSGTQYSRAKSVENALKLFDKGECCNAVVQATKNMVVLHGRDLDKERAIKDIQARAEDSMQRGKLRRSANRTHLTHANLMSLIDGAIAKGFAAKNIEMLPKIKYKSKSAQFDWVMGLSPGVENPVQDIVFTAINMSFSLVGVNFSYSEIMTRIFKTFHVPGEMESWMKSKADWRMGRVKAEVMPLLTVSVRGRRTVEYKPIKALSEVVADKGVITMVKAGMGTGKTRKVGVKACNKVNGSVTAVCHRRSLVREMSAVLNLRHYTDEVTTGQKGFAVCIDSIAKVQATGIKSEVLLIDEVSQVMNSVMTSSVMKNKHAVYEEAKRLINETDYVIGMDAGICDEDIKVIQRLTNKKIVLYVMPEQDTGIKVTIVSAKHNKSNVLISLAVAREEPFVLCSDNKAYIKAAHEYMKSPTG